MIDLGTKTLETERLICMNMKDKYKYIKMMDSQF